MGIDVDKEVRRSLSKWLFEAPTLIRQGVKLRSQASASDATMYWLTMHLDIGGERRHWRSKIVLHGLTLDGRSAMTHIDEEVRAAVVSLVDAVPTTDTPPAPKPFEVGDRVRLSNDGYVGEERRGAAGTVTSDKKPWFLVRVDGDPVAREYLAKYLTHLPAETEGVEVIDLSAEIDGIKVDGAGEFDTKYESTGKSTGVLKIYRKPEPTLAEALDRPVPDDPWLRSAYVEPVKVDRWAHVGRNQIGNFDSQKTSTTMCREFNCTPAETHVWPMGAKPPSDACPHSSLADWRRNKAV